MIIAPLAHPYNGNTHVRLVQLNLDLNPSVAEFHLGKFSGTPPAMPYSAPELPANWDESDELNTAPLPNGISDLGQVVAAIDVELQAHA